jgi:hypothetical protein
LTQGRSAAKRPCEGTRRDSTNQKPGAGGERGGVLAFTGTGPDRSRRGGAGFGLHTDTASRARCARAFILTAVSKERAEEKERVGRTQGEGTQRSDATEGRDETETGKREKIEAQKRD